MGTAAARSELIRQIVDRIVAGYSPERVILFGSHAYGEPDEESDIDLLVVKETGQRPIDRWTELKRLLRDRDRLVAVSPLVYTPQEVEERLAIGDVFLEQVMERGRTLYERPSGSGPRVV